MSNKPRVGILIGSHLPPNEENVLTSLGKMLADTFQLDLIVSTGRERIPAHLQRYYTIHEYSNRARFLRRLPLLTELLISLLILSTYARQQTPDILFHLTKPQTYGIAVALVGRMLGIPFIVRNGGDILNVYKQKQGLRYAYIFIRITCIAYLAFQLAPHIIVIGDTLAEELVRRGIAPEKIRIIPQPIDRDRFQPPANKQAGKQAVGLPADKYVVLFVGRMKKLEAVDLMPAIIERVLQRNDAFIFCFVGPTSPYVATLQDVGGDAVKIVGPVQHTEIAKYYRAADLLIHISGSEGIPNSLLEALACGVPVCANDVGDVATVTTNVFDTPEEFSTFILERHWKYDGIPEILDWESLKNRYIISLKEQISDVPQ